MNEQNSPDVDAGTIATGCAAGLGLGCLQVFIVVLLVIASGVKVVAGRTPAVPAGIVVLSFLMGLAVNVALGYITARKAPRAKMLHAIIVGVLALLLGIVAFVINPSGNGRTAANLFGFLLSIPMNMLGAQWAISSEQPETLQMDE